MSSHAQLQIRYYDGEGRLTYALTLISGLPNAYLSAYPRMARMDALATASKLLREIGLEALVGRQSWNTG